MGADQKTFSSDVLSFEEGADHRAAKLERVFYSPYQEPSFPPMADRFYVALDCEPLIGSIFFIPTNDSARLIALYKTYKNIQEIGLLDGKGHFTRNESFDFSFLASEGCFDAPIPRYLKKLHAFPRKAYRMKNVQHLKPMNDN